MCGRELTWLERWYLSLLPLPPAGVAPNLQIPPPHPIPRPKMIAVQATGCAPIVKAWENGEEHAPVWENAWTAAAGIRVPVAVGDFLIIRAVRESDGFAIAIDEDDIFAARDTIAREEGFLLCPEGAATYAAYRQALGDGRVSKTDRVVLYNCATGLKYPMPSVNKSIDRSKSIDYSQF